jgi:O-antigen ligase
MAAGHLSVLLGRVVEGCWLGVVALVPLFFIPGLLRPFYPPKAMLLQFLALVMVAAVVARWLLEGRGVTGADMRSLMRSRIHVIAVTFGTVVVIATIMSLSPYTSLVGSVNRRQGMLTILSLVSIFLVVSTQLRTRAQLTRLVVVLLVSSGLVSLIGIVEHYVPSFSHWFLSTTYTQRVAATTGNALSLSGYLGMAIPFTLTTGVLVYRRRAGFPCSGLVFTALAGLLTVQLWCLVLSIYSFVLLLYLVPGAMFVALFTLLQVRRRVVVYAALGLLTALVVSGLAIVLPQWQNAVAGTPPHAPGTRVDVETEPYLRSNLYGRARYWVYALNVLPQSISDPQPGDDAPLLRPLVGYGPETYTIVTQKHFPPERRTGMTSGATFRDNPHNHYLYLAATVGLLGLGLWLALVLGCGVILYRLLRRKGTASPPALYALAAGCGVAGFLAHAMFNPIALAEESLYWPCLALIPALAAQRHLRSTDMDVPGQSGAPSTPPSSRTALALLLVVLAAVGGVLSARNPLLAEVAMRDAIVMSASGDPNTVFMYSRATELQPHESTYWGALGGYAHGIALRAQGEAKATILELSLIALRQARDNEPLLTFWHYQLGDALLYAASSTGQSTVDDAVESYQRALGLSPRNAVLANRIAVAHMVGGEWDGAALALQEATQFDPAWTQTLHLKAAFVALEGDALLATQPLLSLIRERPVELHTFARVAATHLLAYGLVEPMATVMLPSLEAQGGDWATVAVRGVLVALTGESAEAALLLTSAIESSPEDALEAVQDTTNYLAGFVPGLRNALVS